MKGIPSHITIVLERKKIYPPLLFSWYEFCYFLWIGMMPHMNWHDWCPIITSICTTFIQRLHNVKVQLIFNVANVMLKPKQWHISFQREVGKFMSLILWIMFKIVGVTGELDLESAAVDHSPLNRNAFYPRAQSTSSSYSNRRKMLCIVTCS